MTQRITSIKLMSDLFKDQSAPSGAETFLKIEVYVCKLSPCSYASFHWVWAKLWLRDKIPHSVLEIVCQLHGF